MDAAKAVQRVKYSITCLSQETRKLPIKQPNPPLKELEKVNKAKIHHKEGIIRIRGEINKIETSPPRQKKQKENMRQIKRLSFLNIKNL